MEPFTDFGLNPKVRREIQSHERISVQPVNREKHLIELGPLHRGLFVFERAIFVLLKDVLVQMLKDQCKLFFIGHIRLTVAFFALFALVSFAALAFAATPFRFRLLLPLVAHLVLLAKVVAEISALLVLQNDLFLLIKAIFPQLLLVIIVCLEA